MIARVILPSRRSEAGFSPPPRSLCRASKHKITQQALSAKRHEARGSMGNIVVLDLMGELPLLLWGLHMVRSEIVRAFGSELRRVLG
jgi:hypothetical protein